MNIYQFMSESPWLACFFGFLIAVLLEALLFRLPSRIMRHWNIHKHGYPPPHCDVDGDFKPDHPQTIQKSTKP